MSQKKTREHPKYTKRKAHTSPDTTHTGRKKQNGHDGWNEKSPVKTYAGPVTSKTRGLRKMIAACNSKVPANKANTATIWPISRKKKKISRSKQPTRIRQVVSKGKCGKQIVESSQRVRIQYGTDTPRKPML